MPIAYISKSNQRTLGSELSIVNEVHIIGTTALNTSTPDQIRLVEVPLQESPSSIAIPGFTEVSTVPGTLEYKVDYANGRITFHSTQNGNTVFVTYKGRGSEVDGEDVNEIQQVFIGSVTTGSPTIGIANLDGTLSDGIVRPNNISTVATDDFLFPNDVTVTGNLTVNGTMTTMNTQTVTVEDNILLLNSNVTGAPTTDSGIEIERGTSPNVTLQWDETTDAWEFNDTSGSPILQAFDTGDVEITGDLLINEVGSNTSLTFDIDKDNDSLVETFTWQTDGSVSLMTLDEIGALDVLLSITTPTLTATTQVNSDLVKGYSGDISIRPFANTTTGIKLANVAGTSILSIDTLNSQVNFNQNYASNFVFENLNTAGETVTPATGQVYFNSDTSQWKGWNGTSWVILG
jgi:hypothetical protein